MSDPGLVRIRFLKTVNMTTVGWGGCGDEIDGYTGGRVLGDGV